MPAPVDDSDASNRVPGNKGIWVGIFCVLVEFLLLFIVYFVAKAHYPEAFLTGPDKLATVAGTTITLLLLTSGYCMVKAVDAVRRDDRRTTLRWIVLAIVLGIGYPVVKYFEIRWNIGGILGLGWVAVRTGIGAYTAHEHGGLEAAAVYWHTTDVIWLVIFPFFYVLR